MNGRFSRSIAATVRVSLISVSGALGMLALSAGAASADSGSSENGLIGSVTSVVQSAAAPVDGIVSEIAGALPLAEVESSSHQAHSLGVPSTSEVVGQVPDVIGSVSVVDVVAPVTDLVDATAAQVPVVNEVVPRDTATAITRPAVEAVDSALAPVLTPVEQTVNPVLDVLAPVTDVVDSVVQPVVPDLPLPGPVEVPEPIQVQEPVEVPEIVETLPVAPGTDQEATASQPAEQVAGKAGAEQTATSEAGGSVTEGGPTSPIDSNAPSAAAAAYAVQLTGVDAALTSSASSSFGIPELPALTASSAKGDASGSGLPSSSPASAAAAGAPGGVGPSDAVDAWRLDAVMGLSASLNPASTLLEGPTFDPGSTPD